MTEAQLGFFGVGNPPEEFDDLSKDPHEIHNLAADPQYRAGIERHRALLADGIGSTGDQGQVVGSDAGLLATMKRWGISA